MRSNAKQYINAGWLIDGSGAPLRKQILLTVENSIVTDISDFREGDRSSLDSSPFFDLSRCTILPPLVDCHVHIALSASTDPRIRKAQLDGSYEDCKPRIAEHLRYFFSYGVLAVRDGGGRLGHAQRYKVETESGESRKGGVILKTAGQAWSQTGRYGAFIGGSPGGSGTLLNAVSKEIDSVDHVKLINSGINSITEFGKETKPQFSLKELQGIVNLARDKRKKVMVHANGRIPVARAVEAGCHSIEHGFFMGEENLQRMADCESVWVPTAITMQTLLEKRNLPKGLPEGSLDVIERNLEHQLQQMAKAKQYGVQMALGTDAGSSGVLHGEAVAGELKLFLRAGLSLVEAIQCASKNGAKLLGIEEEMGIIAKGYPARFVVVRATPSMLPRKLSYLEAIYLDGGFHNKPSTLDVK